MVNGFNAENVLLADRTKSHTLVILTARPLADGCWRPVGRRRRQQNTCLEAGAVIEMNDEPDTFS